MKTLSDSQLEVAIGGSDSFGKDAGQFIGGVGASATSYGTIVLIGISPVFGGAKLLYDGIMAALQ